MLQAAVQERSHVTTFDDDSQATEYNAKESMQCADEFKDLAGGSSSKIAKMEDAAASSATSST